MKNIFFIFTIINIIISVSEILNYHNKLNHDNNSFENNLKERYNNYEYNKNIIKFEKVLNEIIDYYKKINIKTYKSYSILEYLFSLINIDFNNVKKLDSSNINILIFLINNLPNIRSHSYNYKLIKNVILLSYKLIIYEYSNNMDIYNKHKIEIEILLKPYKFNDEYHKYEELFESITTYIELSKIKLKDEMLYEYVKNITIPYLNKLQFTVTSKIGKGGFGIINKIEFKGENYVLKCNQKPNNYDILGEIINNIVINKCNHYILNIKYLSYDRFTDKLCFIMESGDSKFTEVYKLTRNSPNFKYFIKDIYTGISCIHNLGYAHLDLKEDNILIKDGMPKFIDFDSLKKIDNIKGNKVEDKLGTLRYNSYEIENNIPFKYEADIFALGVILYNLEGGLNNPITKDNNKVEYPIMCLKNDFIGNIIKGSLTTKDKILSISDIIKLIN